jgi:hypothetical protein
MMKVVYEIRLKMSGAGSYELLEAEVACFDAAVMIILSNLSLVPDAEYVNNLFLWSSDAIRQALLACKEPATSSRSATQL